MSSPRLHFWIRDEAAEWESIRCRDPYDLQTTWEINRPHGTTSWALVHVGYGNPEPEAPDWLERTFPDGAVLATVAARWALPELFTYHGDPAGSIHGLSTDTGTPVLVLHWDEASSIDKDGHCDSAPAVRPATTPCQRVPLAMEGTVGLNDGLGLSQPIEDLGLSTRALNALLNAGVLRVEQLVGLTHEDLYALDGVGRRSVLDIEMALADVDLRIPEEVSPIDSERLEDVSKNVLHVPQHLRQISIDSLGLPGAVTRTLARRDVVTLGDLEVAWPRLDGGGRVGPSFADTLSEVIDRLSAIGLTKWTRMSAEVPESDRRSIPSLPLDILLAIGSAASVTEEIDALVTGMNDRDRDCFLRRLGVGVNERPTLKLLAEEYGVTRERIRQVVGRRADLLRDSGLRLPISTMVVELLDDAGGMLTPAQISEVASESGVNAGRSIIRALPWLAELGVIPEVTWRDDLEVLLSSAGQKRWFESGRMNERLAAIRKRLRAEFRRVGAAPLALAVEARTAALHLAKAAIPEGSRVIECDDFLVPSPGVRSSLARVVQKMLEVAGALGMSEIHAGVVREPRLRPVPPRDVVSAVLREHPGFTISDGRINSVGLSGSKLSGAERAAVEVFRKAGGMVDTYEFVDAMMEAGFSAPRANQILYGALTESPQPGLYVLVGSAWSAELTEDKARKRLKRPSGGILSTTRLGGGRVVATWRLGRYNLDGVLNPPPEIRSDLENWNALDSTGRAHDVTIRNGFLWGIRRWFQQVKAREGDLVVATFHESRSQIDLRFINHDRGATPGQTNGPPIVPPPPS